MAIKQVTLTINGKQAVVPEGATVVDAAKSIGIDIPVFCHHPKLEPAGMCRMCLVEIGRPMLDRATGQPIIENGLPRIQFLPKLEAACTNRVSEGMVVMTTSQKAVEGQKGTVEFLLTSHPLDCPVCDKGGECPLQDLTMAFGAGKSRFLYSEKQHLQKQVPLGELIWLDRERCIQCARCIRFQSEVAGEPVLGFDERGRTTQIVSLSDPGFDSVFSGNTTDICPVGALTTADFRFGARPWELEAQASICPHCPVGCNTTINTRREVKAGGEKVIKRVMPRQNEEVNEIWLCDKGRFAYQYTENAGRLLKPLIRQGGKQVQATWNVASNIAAENFVKSKKDLVILASGRLANEDLFNLKSLADMAGGKAILFSDIGGGEFTPKSGVAPGTNIGEMGTGDAILVVASDLYQEAPIWWLRVKQAADRGAALIVINPRKTRLEKFAKYVIRYAYGDEVKAVTNFSQQERIFSEFAQAKNAIIFYGNEGLGVQASSALSSACATLLKETGHAGKPNNGLLGVWQRVNDQGAFELGFRPEPQLKEALIGKVVYIVGADPVGDDPALAQALQEAAFIAVQDIIETPTTKIADVVFPAQAFTEREGSYTSGERRVQRFYPAVPAQGDSKPDFAITAQIARAMGYILEGTAASAVFDNLANATEAFSSMNYQKLAEVHGQYPIIGRGDVYYGGTAYENTQGLGIQLGLGAWYAPHLILSEPDDQTINLRPREGELMAVPINRLYDRGSTVYPSELLRKRIGDVSGIIHPTTAEKFGLQAHTSVKLDISGVEAQVTLCHDDTVPTGVILIPRSMGIPIHQPVWVKVN